MVNCQAHISSSLGYIHPLNETLTIVTCSGQYFAHPVTKSGDLFLYFELEISNLEATLCKVSFLLFLWGKDRV